jgi:C4-dicarboxylate-specific signal transduction histidine kinase
MTLSRSISCEIEDAEIVRLDRLVQIGRFVSSFSHEINNCLQVIAGLTELAIDTDGVPPDVAAKLERILHQANRGSGSVRALLTFARERSATVEMSDLARLAEGVLTLRQYPLGRLRIATRFDRAEGQRFVVVGAQRELEQMVLALVLNAEQALAAEEHGPRQLSLACESDARHVSLRVTDNGSGIAPEVERVMFDPFVSGFRDEDLPGLGLAAAQAIALRYGGVIVAGPGPERGTTMTVRLPTARS